MNGQPTSAQPPRNQIIFYVVSAVLIGTFLWRVFVPAHEYPMRSSQVMDIVIDLAMTLGLIGIRNSGPKALFWVALICGLGLFAIRLTGDAAWWTGHLSYSLLPR